MFRFLALLAAFVFTFSSSARAQIETYSFDKPHTQIMFFINHLGFSNSSGKFLDYDGFFVFDHGHPEQSKVEITIKTDSLDMGDEKWNDHMKSADFFNVVSFPDMTFKSTDIKVTGEKTADITGNLTILGVTKPVTLHVVQNNSGKYPFGEKYGAGFSATAKLKRSDFGMTYGLPMVGDDVDVRIEVEGIRNELEGEGANNH